MMKLVIALLLSRLTFFTIGRPLAGALCLILQATQIAWIPAAIWAVDALSQWKTDQKIRGRWSRGEWMTWAISPKAGMPREVTG